MRTLNSRALIYSFGPRSRGSLGGLGASETRCLGAPGMRCGGSIRPAAAEVSFPAYSSPSDSILAARQAELEQVRAERAAVEAELAALQARASGREVGRRAVAARGGAPSPAAVEAGATAPPEVVLEDGGVVRLTDQEPGAWPRERLGPLANAPTAALVGAGVVGLLVLRALFKRKG